jgi:hypothetical protein
MKEWTEGWLGVRLGQDRFLKLVDFLMKPELKSTLDS